MRHEMNKFLKAAYGSKPADSGISSIALSVTMGQLCQVLESGLDRPILDETHLDGAYAVSVHSDAVSTREFLHVLCGKLGLVATAARRDVSMLVVRQR
jgi:uncharacterized protein (TIGR03435 family)